jgi:hypothetical protein
MALLGALSFSLTQNAASIAVALAVPFGIALLYVGLAYAGDPRLEFDRTGFTDGLPPWKWGRIGWDEVSDVEFRSGLGRLSFTPRNPDQFFREHHPRHPIGRVWSRIQTPRRISFVLGGLMLTPPAWEALEALGELLAEQFRRYRIRLRGESNYLSTLRLPAARQTDYGPSGANSQNRIAGSVFLLVGLYFCMVLVLGIVQDPGAHEASAAALIFGLVATAYAWVSLSTVGRLSKSWPLRSSWSRAGVAYMMPLLILILPFAFARVAPALLLGATSVPGDLIPQLELSVLAGYSCALGINLLWPRAR